jgi:hypothetical protein
MILRIKTKSSLETHTNLILQEFDPKHSQILNIEFKNDIYPKVYISWKNRK